MTSPATPLTQYFAEMLGLRPDAHIHAQLRRRLSPLMDRLDMRADDYLTFVSQGTAAGDNERRRAVQRVTVHETYFYREHAHFEILNGSIFPEFVRWRGETGTSSVVRILSAGCSSGEEAYSLAMCARDNTGLDFKIYGMDIGSDSVEQAKRGVYRKNSFRGFLPEALKQRYLIEDGDEVRVIKLIRDHAEFMLGNMLTPGVFETFGAVDVIFCRNVLIYFNEDARRRIIDALYACLRPGGVLFLGHSESLFQVPSTFRLLSFTDGLVYVKPFADESLPAYGGRYEQST